ncbi:MAG: peptidoglycan DD-metalloendopeptidase family protein [Lachnospiraceae bacterium]|nr:peptidoglycan DD-metalloendopeptidase family protein [Lachnospiraceae bacterium]
MSRQSSFNRNRKDNTKKERIIMIASSVFVLAALTMTGIYVRRNSEQTENDGYHIDFSVLEEVQNPPVQDEIEEIEEIENIGDIGNIEDIENIGNLDADADLSQMLEDDLDYFPTEPVDSGLVEIPGLTDSIVSEDGANGEQTAAEGARTQSLAEELAADQAAMDADAGRLVENVPPSYTAGETLVWPVSGSVLIPYSMDKTVRFATLQQYKYSPALVMSAQEGDVISAAAGGRVARIFSNEEIGNAVTVDIGNGYKITYGQLKDITVTEGSYVEKGGIIGYVAVPTKYYSVEGTNAYFALTLNGEPADPLGALQ